MGEVSRLLKFKVIRQRSGLGILWNACPLSGMWRHFVWHGKDFKCILNLVSMEFLRRKNVDIVLLCLENSTTKIGMKEKKVLISTLNISLFSSVCSDFIFLKICNFWYIFIFQILLVVFFFVHFSFSLRIFYSILLLLNIGKILTAYFTLFLIRQQFYQNFTQFSKLHWQCFPFGIFLL